MRGLMFDNAGDDSSDTIFPIVIGEKRKRDRKSAISPHEDEEVVEEHGLGRQNIVEEFLRNKDHQISENRVETGLNPQLSIGEWSHEEVAS